MKCPFYHHWLGSQARHLLVLHFHCWRAHIYSKYALENSHQISALVRRWVRSLYLPLAYSFSFWYLIYPAHIVVDRKFAEYQLCFWRCRNPIFSLWRFVRSFKCHSTVFIYPVTDECSQKASVQVEGTTVQLSVVSNLSLTFCYKIVVWVDVLVLEVYACQV